MDDRTLPGIITSSSAGSRPTIPRANFKNKFTLLTGVAVKLTQKNGRDVVEALPRMPPLWISASKSDIHSSELSEEELLLKGLTHCRQEKGSVTLLTFEKYLVEMVLPYVKEHIPGLQKEVKEFLLTYDMPKIHDVSDEVLQKFLDAGIHIYGLPNNSTHWSQPCDAYQVFGTFKRWYYHHLDMKLVEMGARLDRQNKGNNAKKTQIVLGSQELLPIVGKALAAITDPCVVSSIVVKGLAPGHTEASRVTRREAQKLVIQEAPDLVNVGSRASDHEMSSRKICSITPPAVATSSKPTWPP